MAFQEWPKCLYQPDGSPKVFETAADVPTEEGWAEYAEVYDDRGELRPADAGEAAEKDALRQALTAKGVTFGPKWGAKRLAQALADVEQDTGS